MMKASLIVLFALVAVALAATDFSKCKGKGEFVLLADVGSSGTRFYLIKHAKSKFTIYEGPKSANGWGRMTDTSQASMEGELDAVYKKLHTLIKKKQAAKGGFGLAKSDVGANDIIACAPLFIGATAGMRGVFNKDPTAARAMIKNTKAADKKLRPAAKANTVFEIISGPMEGYFGFRSAIAQNVQALDLEKGVFVKKGARIKLADAGKLFYMEIGGASVQFANIVKDEAAGKFLELASNKHSSFVEVDSKYFFSRGSCIPGEKFTLMSNSCLGCAGNRMTANALAVAAGKPGKKNSKNAKTSGCIAPGVVVKDHGGKRGICYPSDAGFAYDCSDLNDQKLSPGGETKPLAAYLKGGSNTITGKPNFAECCADVRTVLSGNMEFDGNAGSSPAKLVKYKKFFDAVSKGIKDAKEEIKHVFINSGGVVGNIKKGGYKFATNGFIPVTDVRDGFTDACEKKTPYNGRFDFNRCVPLAIVDQTISGSNRLVNALEPSKVKFGSAAVGWEVGAAEFVYQLLVKGNKKCHTTAFAPDVENSELKGHDKSF